MTMLRTFVFSVRLFGYRRYFFFGVFFLGAFTAGCGGGFFLGSGSPGSQGLVMLFIIILLFCGQVRRFSNGYCVARLISRSLVVPAGRSRLAI